MYREPRSKILETSCNPVTLDDGRGGIFTGFPVFEQKIVEFNAIFTNPGKQRGFHMHPEFNEYVLVMSGHGAYVEYDPGCTSESVMGGEDLVFEPTKHVFKMGPGDCIYFPRNTYHTFYAITEVAMVAMLDKKWDDCDVPLVPLDVEAFVDG